MATAELPRAGYSPTEFAKVSTLSPSGVYEAIKRGDIRAVKIGGRLVIPASEIDRLLTVGEDE